MRNSTQLFLSLLQLILTDTDLTPLDTVCPRFVKLISSDGHEFIVKREDALTSGTIKAMLSGPGQFSENETNEVNFREIPSHVLQKVCMYFTYKVRFTNSSTEIPEFPIPPEIALELLMAANFLDC